MSEIPKVVQVLHNLKKHEESNSISDTAFAECFAGRVQAYDVAIQNLEPYFTDLLEHIDGEIEKWEKAIKEQSKYDIISRMAIPVYEDKIAIYNSIRNKITGGSDGK